MLNIKLKTFIEIFQRNTYGTEIKKFSRFRIYLFNKFKLDPIIVGI